MDIIEQMNLAQQAANVIKSMRERLESQQAVMQKALDAGRESSAVAREAVGAMRHAADLLADGKHSEAHKFLENALGIHHDLLH